MRSGLLLILEKPHIFTAPLTTIPDEPYTHSPKSQLRSSMHGSLKWDSFLGPLISGRRRILGT